MEEKGQRVLIERRKLISGGKKEGEVKARWVHSGEKDREYSAWLGGDTGNQIVSWLLGGGGRVPAS